MCYSCDVTDVMCYALNHLNTPEIRICFSFMSLPIIKEVAMDYVCKSQDILYLQATLITNSQSGGDS
ncbi:Hypothetical predicted protein [Octopus vulgaris]|uniref:Uncharacterized protein n=1 Tax=Octopus vulgaris TaxID=6645 RepID=A0AA36F7J0_OCTVU|nr:Hypothetical predicted protein [Octopus vulgaris]